MDERALATAVIRVPDHVAYRSFDAETVLLNLSTGQYHGLNVTGGRMLEVLRQTGSFTETAETVAREFKQPPAEVARDLAELCRSLLERGLIEVEPRR